MAKKRQAKRRVKRLKLMRGGALLAEGSLWLWLFFVWWIHDETAKDPFRLPKEMASDALILLSLVGLAFQLASLQSLGWRNLLRLPTLRLAIPWLAAACLGLLSTDHSSQVLRGLAALALGAGALVGWSLGFTASKLRRLLRGLLIPASLLSFFALLQYFGLYRPFDFVGDLESQRLGLTSFAGSAGDLAVFLVLPALLVQVELILARGRARWWASAALVLIFSALLVSQTLTALVALAVASLVLWLGLFPVRRVVATAVAGMMITGLLVLAVGPLHQRVQSKAEDLVAGRVNHLLTGRLDGWRAALWMFQEHPLTGVGLGAYGAEFNRAKLALQEKGVSFFRATKEPTFVNAHNEYLEVAAEMGLPGIAAMLWAAWVLLQILRRFPRGPDRALAWAGCTAVAVIALAQFPFRLSLTAVPVILFLAWTFAAAPQQIPDSAQEAS